MLKHFEVVHQEDNPYNCEQCDLKFTTQNRLDNHKCLKGKNVLNKDPQIMAKCDICQIEFTFKYSFGPHNKRFHTKKPHPCSICNEILSTKFDYDQHMEENHENEKKCNICNKIFASKRAASNYLKTHVRIVHEMGKHKCDRCSQTFESDDDLTLHEEVLHLGQKLKCDLCEKSYHKKSSLSIHKKSFHAGETISCETCQTLFSSQSTLLEHKKSIHEGQRLECRLCEKTFSQRGRLSEHIKSIHEGKSSKCDLCQKSCKNCSSK